MIVGIGRALSQQGQVFYLPVVDNHGVGAGSLKPVGPQGTALRQARRCSSKGKDEKLSGLVGVVRRARARWRAHRSGLRRRSDVSIDGLRSARS
jgi:hypothetical protein